MEPLGGHRHKESFNTSLGDSERQLDGADQDEEEEKRRRAEQRGPTFGSGGGSGQVGAVRAAHVVAGVPLLHTA